jgi:hypothetical protein
MEEFIAEQIAAQRADLDADPGKWPPYRHILEPLSLIAFYFCVFNARKLCLFFLSKLYFVCGTGTVQTDQQRFRSFPHRQPVCA